MPSHTDIIKAHGGATKLAADLAAAGLSDMTPGRVQQWANRNSIPPEFWQVLHRIRVTTLADLADAKALPIPDDVETGSMPDVSHAEAAASPTIAEANSGQPTGEAQVAE